MFGCRLPGNFNCSVFFDLVSTLANSQWSKPNVRTMLLLPVRRLNRNPAVEVSLKQYWSLVTIIVGGLPTTPAHKILHVL